MDNKDKNIAGSKEYLAYRQSFAWLFDLQPCNIQKKSFIEGLVLEEYIYEDKKINPDTGYLTHYAAVKTLLKNSNGQLIKEIKSIDGHFFAHLIKHSNSKNYLMYNTDLYGYTVLDLSNYEAIDYMPYHSFNGGETFIWCEKYYCPVNDLLIVEGCYWACPWGLEFYDFSQPMQLPLPKYSDSYQLEAKLDIAGDNDISFAGFTQQGDCLINCSDQAGKKVTKTVTLAQLRQKLPGT